MWSLFRKSTPNSYKLGFSKWTTSSRRTLSFTFKRPVKSTPHRRLSEEERKAAFMRTMMAAREAKYRKSTHTFFLYSASTIIAAGALAYAAVPFYGYICRTTGYGGTPQIDSDKFTAEKMVAVQRKRRITINFSGEVSSTVPWQFRPEQKQVKVLPGETALAFYKAKNVSKNDIIGMATYSVIPENAASYFNKIQCFCFEEQQLRAGEEVDMPVFFFIDPDFMKDPKMNNVDDLVLHYTFFRAQRDSSGRLSPMQETDEDREAAQKSLEATQYSVR